MHYNEQKRAEEREQVEEREQGAVVSGVTKPPEEAGGQPPGQQLGNN